ncbi:MAG: DUF6125 family protein [Dehalococcoidia bacterium]|nr:DUF6125 family protein [Dehalococcoidia bacterium]
MEIADYTGKFDPDFGPDKLTRETLLKLLKMYSEYIRRVDGYWYVTVMNRWGNEAALECDLDVWEKAQVWEIKSTTSLLNIHGDDVLTMMKAMQSSPWMWLYDYDVDIKSRDHAILTFRTCPILASIEKEGTGREELLCHGLEPKVFRVIADYFNPKIEVIPLKLPPRKASDEIACRWEMKLDR